MEDSLHIDPDLIVNNPTLEDVRKILDGHSYKFFTWDEDDENDQPLCIDVQTANVMVTVFDALQKPKYKKYFQEQITKSRLYFGRLIEICWGAVK